LRYYSRFFAPEDIYVLDHGSTDGSTDGNGFVCVRLPASAVDAELQRDYVQQRQHELIAEYETVLYTDVDEFVVPHPSIGDLKDYIIEKFGWDYVKCTGYEILHMKGEPKWDTSRPVMEQRSSWFANPQYMNKALLTKVPMRWDAGLHSLDPAQDKYAPNPDPMLYLIHLHRMDYDLCLARNHMLNTRPRSSKDIEKGWSDHRHIVDPKHFEAWFYGNYATGVQPIPDDWKEAII
jgi:hypothetical protein